VLIDRRRVGAGTIELIVRNVPAGQARMVAIVAGVTQAMVVSALLQWSTRQMPRVMAAVLALTLIASGLGAVTPTRRRAEAIPAASTDGRPNVLLIVIDTLRADHLGVYGYERTTSPALDALAANGLLFERAFSQSSWTKPATASLLTGRCPSQHQTSSESARFPTPRPRSQSGCGRSDIARPCCRRIPGSARSTASIRGSTTSCRSTTSGSCATRSSCRSSDARRSSRAVGCSSTTREDTPSWVSSRLPIATRSSSTRRVQWLGLHGRAPFFLYLHMMSPHHPYDPPPPFDRFVPDRTHRPIKNYPRKSYRLFESGDPLAPDDLADMVARLRRRRAVRRQRSWTSS
jgi:hypothetical protein